MFGCHTEQPCTFHSMNNESIQALFQKAKDGDIEAFGSIYDSYFTQVYRFLYYRTKHRELAEDLVQTVFIKVFARIEDIDATYPKAYLFTVARNILTDHWRKKIEYSYDETASHERTDPNATRSLEEKMNDEQDIDRILARLDTLSDDQQDVVLLKYVHDLTTPEIALALGKSEVTIRKIQSRALKSLKTTLMRDI